MMMKRVLALGFFDGVHLGHAALIRRTRERAEALGAVPAVLTFDVHPDTLVRGERVPLITGCLKDHCDGDWSLNSHQYERETGLFHWEWTFQIEG